jgi:hypothetical protein
MSPKHGFHLQMLPLSVGMPEQTIIAWDLETIPDLTPAARILGLGMAPEAEVREALGPRLPQASSPQDCLYRCPGGDLSTGGLAC